MNLNKIINLIINHYQNILKIKKIIIQSNLKIKFNIKMNNNNTNNGKIINKTHHKGHSHK